MSTDSFTLAAVVEDIFATYKRERSDIRERLPNRIAYCLTQLSTQYPFWFMTVEPGAIGPSLFPFAATPTYTDLAESAWFDIGWFHANQGQRDYYFSVPDDPAMVTDTSRWRRIQVQTISSLYAWPQAGGQPRKIQVKDPDDFLRMGDWTQSQGEPDYAVLYTINRESYLRFNRTPDSNIYVYSTRFVQHGFPSFQSDKDTNPFFVYHPKIVQVMGCMEVAEMFRDWDGYQSYKGMLNGTVSAYTGKRTPGLLDELKQESRRMRQQTSEGYEQYTAPPSRGGSWPFRPSQSGEVYWQDYP